MPYSKIVNPVALPPGRARLSTKPAPTGSMTTANTIGTVRVACSNGATVAVPVPARMTSGASAASSAACLRMSSGLVVAQRMSIVYVAAVAPAQLLQALLERCDAGLIVSIVGGRRPTARRCAVRGRSAAPAPRAATRPRRREAMMNSRRFITCCLFDHFVGAVLHGLRHGDPQCLCGLEIDDELDFHWLLYR